MEGVRIILKQVAYGTNSFTPLYPGEPIFDPSTKRLGIGIGGYGAVWYPRATATGDMQFDEGQGLVSSDGSYSLRFTQSGIKWNVSGQDVLSTRGTNGVAIQSSIMMRNSAGADVVVMGYGHWLAIMATLMNIKPLLRKFVANTATNGDVNALFTLLSSIDPTALDPAFPEGPAL